METIKISEAQERLLKNIVDSGGARYHESWSGRPPFYCYANGAGGTLRMPTMGILIDRGFLKKTAITKHGGFLAVPTELAKRYLEVRMASQKRSTS